MKQVIILLAISNFAFGVPASSPTESMRELNQLNHAVQKALPAGWSARISPSKQERSNVPVLIVSRDEKALGTFIYPNPPREEPKAKPCAIEFRFTAMPYISPGEYKLLCKQNTLRNQKRHEFEAQLSNIKWGWMGGKPFPPTAYHPSTIEEETLIQAYAFLWQETEPTPVPDLRYKSLSFRSALALNFQSTDENTQKEIDGVRETVVALFEKYQD